MIKPASITAKKAIIIDSVRNWIISFNLFEPSVFLIPTSLALVVDLAVERLIKFIQAITRIINAIIEKI